jgi:uncharacterized protein YjbI with pentapeptide repeats
MGDYPGYDWSGWKFKQDEPGSDFNRGKLISANGSGLIFAGSNFKEADLTQCMMLKTDMDFCDFSDATMKGGDFTGANLQNSNFMKADLSDASLREANLSQTRFDRAILSDTDFGGANLASARLQDVDLSVSKGLTQEQLNSAEGDSTVILPEGLSRPAHWLANDPPADEE